MQSFEWIDARTVEEAAELLGTSSPRGPVVAKAGGMDLLDLMKEGIIAPARVVNLGKIDALRALQYSEAEGLRIGALTTLATLASDSRIRAHYPALASAAAHAATPQVRNAATLGGNLLQRPRCWYFRNRHFHTERGDTAREESQYSAIFDNATTAMVHASTLATALIAYDASIHLSAGQHHSRTLALHDFLLPPDMHRDRDTLIDQNEILTHITMPALPANTHAVYHKQTERDSYDWPICDVAVVLRMQDDIVDKASIVLGAVAPRPRRAIECEQLLSGCSINECLAADAARAAVAGATPFAKNAYKVPILETVIRRTILACV